VLNTQHANGNPMTSIPQMARGSNRPCSGAMIACQYQNSRCRCFVGEQADSSFSNTSSSIFGDYVLSKASLANS
jgi:hypothetical protein